MNPVVHRTTEGESGDGVLMGDLLGCNDLLMPTSKIPSRMSSPEHSSAPGSTNPGDLPIHVHTGGRLGASMESSKVNPMDWAMVLSLSGCLVTCPKLSPDGGGNRFGKY